MYYNKNSNLIKFVILILIRSYLVFLWHETFFPYFFWTSSNIFLFSLFQISKSSAMMKIFSLLLEDVEITHWCTMEMPITNIMSRKKDSEYPGGVWKDILVAELMFTQMMDFWITKKVSRMINYITIHRLLLFPSSLMAKILNTIFKWKINFKFCL